MQGAQKKSAGEVFEAAVETGIGLAAISAEWVGRLLEQVSPTLSPARQRGATLVQGLKQRGRESGSGLRKCALDAVEYLKDKSGVAQNADLQALKQKVASLEQEVARLSAEKADTPS